MIYYHSIFPNLNEVVSAIIADCRGTFDFYHVIVCHDTRNPPSEGYWFYFYVEEIYKHRETSSEIKAKYDKRTNTHFRVITFVFPDNRIRYPHTDRRNINNRINDCRIVLDKAL